MNIAELERRRISLDALISEEIARHKKSIDAFKVELADANRLIAASADGIDVGVLKLAESVIEVRGSYDKAGDDRAYAVQKAIDDLANGAKNLKKAYVGTKQYAHWHGQFVECSYGMGPSHGSVIFSIGIRRSELGRDLTDGEIEASLYYLRNLQRIQKASSQVAA
ncbi:hypothetical protein CRX42_07280 [Pseudomonas jessenii]|uniref:Uncharacterized protein n=1 Tax=Pseudomonas jessenii TaxID=77298 RepID=A0A2W0F303_PSEJE|nr:hypothetical protein [Pseudomonas jessenii]PYY71211.1 hypothetical protein CRX42_07280 [Pseudomonas jessenii]